MKTIASFTSSHSKKGEERHLTSFLFLPIVFAGFVSPVWRVKERGKKRERERRGREKRKKSTSKRSEERVKRRRKGRKKNGKDFQWWFRWWRGHNPRIHRCSQVITLSFSLSLFSLSLLYFGSNSFVTNEWPVKFHLGAWRRGFKNDDFFQFDFLFGIVRDYYVCMRKTMEKRWLHSMDDAEEIPCLSIRICLDQACLVSEWLCVCATTFCILVDRFVSPFIWI